MMTTSLSNIYRMKESLLPISMFIRTHGLAYSMTPDFCQLATVFVFEQRVFTTALSVFEHCAIPQKLFITIVNLLINQSYTLAFLYITLYIITCTSLLFFFILYTFEEGYLAPQGNITIKRQPQVQHYFIDCINILDWVCNQQNKNIFSYVSSKQHVYEPHKFYKKLCSHIKE